MSGTYDIPLGQMHFAQSEHEVKHAHMHMCVLECIVSKTTENIWK
jgi:hypothetical protein